MSFSALSDKGLIRNYLAHVLLSGLLLGASTPTLGLWPLIFVAFAPLLCVVEHAWARQRLGMARAFLYGLLAGIFYCTPLFVPLASLESWILLPLVVLGYAAVQFGVLAAGIVFGLRAGLQGVTLSLWVACLWVSVEILASDVFVQAVSMATGLTLWRCPLLIQTADFGGAFAASFWIIAVNVLVARWLLDGWRVCRTWGAVVLVLTLAVIGYGYVRLSAPQSGSGSSEDKPLTVTLVQSAVETEKKEERDTIRAVLDQLVKRTLEATGARGALTDLVVWPETSVPVYLRSLEEKEIVDELLRTAKAAQAPILVGAFGLKKLGAGDVETYNADFLVPPKGYIAQEYHKAILIPFYERWPFYSWLPAWFRGRVEGVQESPGNELGLLELSTGRKFGTFICWETFFPGYVRQTVRDGAQFLVNNTNDDAYYLDLGHTYRIPLAVSIFRAVENRLYLLRCTNMGISMLVSPRGEIVSSLPLAKGGALSVQFVPSVGESFIVRRGFVLAKSLFWVTVAWAVLLALRRRIWTRR